MSFSLFKMHMHSTGNHRGRTKNYFVYSKIEGGRTGVIRPGIHFACGGNVILNIISALISYFSSATIN